jgi:O-antigen ligase
MKTRSYSTITQKLLSVLILSLFSLVSLLIYTGYNIFSSQSYNDWRLFEVIIIIIIFLYNVIFYNQSSNLHKNNKILYLSIILFIFFGFISSIYQAQYITRAIRDWSLYSSILLSFISLAHLIHRNPKESKIALIIMACVPIFFIIGFLYQILFYYLIPINPKPSIMKTRQVQFTNDRIFGDTTLVIVFVLAGLICSTSHRQFRFFLIFLCISMSILLMFSGGRGILLSTIGAITLGLALNKHIRKPILYFLLNMIIAFILGNALIYLLSQDLSQGTILRADSSGRGLIIKQALENFMRSPLLGIGPAHSVFVFDTTTISHPHNLFLQLLSEWGTFAFSAFIIICSILSVKIIVYIKDEKSPFNVFIFMGTLAFYINCNFNGAHIYSSSHIYGIFITSWLFSLYFIKTKNNNSFKSLLNKTVYALIVCLLAITTYMALACGLNAPIEASDGGPRFWLTDSPHDDSICKSP